MYECKVKYNVRTNDVDFDENMKPSSYLSFFQDSAGCSADELGFGFEEMQKHGAFFVLSSVYCEIEEPVKYKEEVVCKTWPLTPKMVVMGREYVLEKDGKVCAKGTSRWCLLRKEDFKIMPVSSYDCLKSDKYRSDRAVGFESWKIKSIASDENYVYTHTVRHGDYDHNQHVNNTRYADFCMDAFDIQFLKRKTVKNFLVNYSKQCTIGQEIKIYKKQTEENKFVLEGVSDEGTCVLFAVEFKDKE